jgi:hypothetical protein
MSDDFDLGLAVADAANVLLVAPGVGDAADRLCCDVVTAGGSRPDELIGVEIAGSPAETIRTWRDKLGPGPSVSCLAVDGVSRSSSSDVPSGVGTATIEYVNCSSPVRELGERISAKLDESTETAVCFDSITDLQECVGQEATFGFLHAIGSRIRTSDATGYYHIDRTVHDEATMTLYSTLFDAVVEVGSDHSE